MRAVNPFSPSPVHCALAIASDFCSLAAVAKWCHAQNVRSTPLLPFRFLFQPSLPAIICPCSPVPPVRIPRFPPAPHRAYTATWRRSGVGLGCVDGCVFSLLYLRLPSTHSYIHTRIHTLGLFFFFFLLLVAFIFAVFSANKVLQTASLRHDTHSSARLYGQIASLVPFWRACKTCEPLFFDEPREKKKEKNGKWALCSFGRRKKKNERMR